MELSREASRVVREHTHLTPLSPSATLSRLSRAKVYLKYENLQKTGSFKVRGALYKVFKVKGRAGGVVAASAGNHAQGVAYAGSIIGMPSVIVMPEYASISKVEATKSYGAEVVLYGRVYDDAYVKALEIAESRGFEFVHAFDDIDVIAGQATLGLDIVEQLQDFDVIFVPVGGGGLISGVASIVKARNPGVKVIGVEPEAAPKMLYSLKAGKPVSIEPKYSIAEGLVTKKPGELTFQIVSELVDDIVTVSEEELSEAIYLLLERKKTLVEGAGAASVAALLSGRVNVEEKKAVAILSGGNIDMTVISKVIVKGLSKARRVVRISGYVLDRPGQLKRVLEVIASHRGNVLDVHHDWSDPRIPAWHAKVTIMFETPSIQATNNIIEGLLREGYEFSLEG
ncbi:MAG: threonine ammonia-lyase [Thermoprotei archaeon]|nr:threonine ammonia-lyase [Thermoprotei archaeon]